MQLLIALLMACALMPVSAAFVGGGESPCHTVSDEHRAGANEHGLLSASHHAMSDTGGEHLCDEDPIPLQGELTPPLIGWWAVLTLLVTLLMQPSAAGQLRRCRAPPRYPPSLRSHLAIARIQV